MGVVDGSEKQPAAYATLASELSSNAALTLVAANTAIAEWKEKNDWARMLLCAAIDGKILKKLINCMTAFKKWSRLFSLYESHAADNKHLLQAQFFSTGWTPNTKSWLISVWSGQ